MSQSDGVGTYFQSCGLNQASWELVDKQVAFLAPLLLPSPFPVPACCKPRSSAWLITGIYLGDLCWHCGQRVDRPLGCRFILLMQLLA